MTRDPDPGELCSCGAAAAVVFVLDDREVPWCVIPCVPEYRRSRA